jgi:hypothetical protein
MTNRFDILLHPDDVRWAAAEGVSETVIAAVLLLHERSVKEIAAELSAAELEQVIKLVGRSPRVYPPGTLDVLKHRRALVSPEGPQPSGESTRSVVAAEKQHAGTPGADPRGQPETRTPARPNTGADDRRSVIQVGSPRANGVGSPRANGLLLYSSRCLFARLTVRLRMKQVLGTAKRHHERR